MFINLTKPIAFPNEDYMIEAMSDGTSLLSHQACMYFSHFATKSKEMRSLFFALSQPGYKFVLYKNKKTRKNPVM